MKHTIFFGLIVIAMIIASGCSEDNNTNVYIEYPEVVEEPSPEVPVEELTCNTKLVGFRGNLTEEDEQSLASAKLRCQVIFPEAPCLKVFIKKRKQVYHAICGKFHESEN